MNETLIDETLFKDLKKIFSSIGIKYNKGAELAVNEWVITDEDTEIIDEVNFDEYRFTVEAVFERRDFKKARRSDFFNELKERFVLESRDVNKVENKRIKLIMVLRQAVMTC